jgi:hypothetical protein
VKLCYCLDIAYGCFACILAVMCFGPLLWILPINQGDKEGYAILLGIPLMFAAFLLGIAGIVFAGTHWKEWPLAAMALTGIAFLLSWNLDTRAMEIAAVLYATLLASLCGRWFFSQRRKMKQADNY